MSLLEVIGSAQISGLFFTDDKTSLRTQWINQLPTNHFFVRLFYTGWHKKVTSGCHEAESISHESVAKNLR